MLKRKHEIPLNELHTLGQVGSFLGILFLSS